MSYCKITHLFLTLIFQLWLGALVSQATTYYVATNGLGNGTSWELATNNIQGAISLATTADDVVSVSNGVYQTGGVTNWPAGSALTNRVAITNAITVKSANNDPINTIIKGAWDPNTTNGPAAVRGVYIVSGSSLIGFTITNCATLRTNESMVKASLVGGGVYSLGTASNCVITDNRSFGDSQNGGGGAYGGSYFNCTLIGNSTRTRGGGADAVILSNCTIACNYSQDYAGGTFNATLYNCLVISNVAAVNAGGTYQGSLYNCTVAYNVGNGVMYPGLVRNCLIYGNTARGVSLLRGLDSKAECCTIVANGWYGIDNTQNKPSTNIVLNCIIYSNSPGDWCQEATTYLAFTNSCTYPSNSAGWSAGNTTNNPVLVDFGTGTGTNHVAGNYRLSPNSPCVNSGLYQTWMTGAVDLDGNRRLDQLNGCVDMGAYEFIHTITLISGH